MPWKSKLTLCKKEFLSRDYHFDSWLHYSEDSRFRQIQNLQVSQKQKKENQVVRKFPFVASSGKRSSPLCHRIWPTKPNHCPENQVDKVLNDKGQGASRQPQG